MPTPRVLLASCAALPTSDCDEEGLVDALAAVGIAAQWAPWDDPDADFAAADLVVLRATWDYPLRRAEFLDWCARVPRLVNPAPVVAWNTDKAYLLDLALQGVAVVPTGLLPPGSGLPAGVASEGTPVVLKPAVGAGSRGAGLFHSAAAAAEHLALLHSAGHTAVLQPYQPEVARSGEAALVFLGGQYSHAFGKASMLGPDGGAPEDASGMFRTEHLSAATPDAAQRRLAESALDAVARRFGMPRSALPYGRVDLVTGTDGDPLLLELELVEPSLGFRHTDRAALDRFAAALRDAAVTSG